MLVTSMLLVVFFFKQKTAYEMRISDWSSDVCSSDLFVTARHIVGEHLRRSRIVAIDLVADLDSLNIVDDEISAHRRLSGQEELARLHDILQTSPPKCRQAFALKQFQDFSDRQIVV